MSEQEKFTQELEPAITAQSQALHHVNEELTATAREEFLMFIKGMRAQMLKTDIEQSLQRTVGRTVANSPALPERQTTKQTRS